MFFSNIFFGQDYISEGHKRLNFAKTYVELSTQFTNLFSGQTIVNSQIVNFKNSETVQPFLNIGGIHFWGHADFYFSIPLSAPINLTESNNINFKFNQSIVTGARFFPIAIKNNAIRPYLGASWSVLNIKGNEDQPFFTKNEITFDGGFLYNFNDFMVRLGVNVYPDNKWNYPITKTISQEIKPPNWSTYFGLIYAFETSKSKNMEVENQKLNETPLVSSPTKNAIKNRDWFLGIGPSTSFMIQNSEYNNKSYPYFNKKPISSTFFDISLGYHFNKLGLVSAVSYRNPTFTYNGFGTEQIIKKSSLSFEVYKYLTDYSGFTPYIGFNLSYNDIYFSETNISNSIYKNFKKITPGFTFGWDILPGKTEQWIVLRTNLRWFPLDKINVNGLDFSLNQIEYNVIQLVIYPSRYKNAKTKRDK